MTLAEATALVRASDQQCPFCGGPRECSARAYAENPHCAACLHERMALAQLEAHENYLVLRRVPPVASWRLQPAVGEVVRACIIDTETTGVGDDAEVVELAILPFDYCKETGRVVAVHPGFSSFCQPSKPIPAEATAIHGITDEMVAGCSISDEQVAAAVGGAKLLLAHNAQFDRKMAAKWPLLDTIPWGCSWFDIDWRAGGVESGKLAFILMRFGFFFDGHHAGDDCLATLFMLTQKLGEHQALFALLQKLREPLYKVTLRGTRFETKDLIKGRGGYRWNAADKSWWKTVSNVDEEVKWFGQQIDSGAIFAEKLPALLRHSAKLEAA